jgi:hypothetical protein
MDPALRFVLLLAGGIVVVVGWVAFGVAHVLPSSRGEVVTPVAAHDEPTPARRGASASRPAGTPEGDREVDEAGNVCESAEGPEYEPLHEAELAALDRAIPEGETELDAPPASAARELAAAKPPVPDATTPDELAASGDGTEEELPSQDASEGTAAEPPDYYRVTPEGAAAIASLYGAGRGFTGVGAGDGYTSVGAGRGFTGQGAGDDGFTGPFGSKEALRAAQQAIVDAQAQQPRP